MQFGEELMRDMVPHTVHDMRSFYPSRGPFYRTDLIQQDKQWLTENVIRGPWGYLEHT